MLARAVGAVPRRARPPGRVPSLASWSRPSSALHRSFPAHATDASVHRAARSATLPVRRPALPRTRPFLPNRLLSTAASPSPSSSVHPAAERPVQPRSDLKLRPYQVDCIRAVLEELERGEYSRLGVSAPTGACTSSRVGDSMPSNWENEQGVEVLRVDIARG